jgi:hypothetical protein
MHEPHVTEPMPDPAEPPPLAGAADVDAAAIGSTAAITPNAIPTETHRRFIAPPLSLNVRFDPDVGGL